ncbi:hypothetical protein chiPu_0024090, partial [Chiloscyllium punctatum]|nr:hypothetical protein [Chiloscyllium punctatum]
MGERRVDRGSIVLYKNTERGKSCPGSGLGGLTPRRERRWIEDPPQGWGCVWRQFRDPSFGRQRETERDRERERQRECLTLTDQQQNEFQA